MNYLTWSDDEFLKEEKYRLRICCAKQLDLLFGTRTAEVEGLTACIIGELHFDLYDDAPGTVLFESDSQQLVDITRCGCIDDVRETCLEHFNALREKYARALAVKEGLFRPRLIRIEDALGRAVDLYEFGRGWFDEVLSPSEWSAVTRRIQQCQVEASRYRASANLTAASQLEKMGSHLAMILSISRYRLSGKQSNR